MIKEEEIEIGISYRNITHYKKLGYDAKLHNKLKVKSLDLKYGSSKIFITAICDVCKKETYLSFYKYAKNKERHGFYGCKSCSRIKARMTSQEKWGVDNWMQLNESKEIITKNNMKKYGVKTTLLNPEIIEKIENTNGERYGTKTGRPPENKRIIKNKSIKIEFKNNTNEVLKYEIFDIDCVELNETNKDYLEYRRIVRKFTRRNIKKLFKFWNKLDYYDNDNISENFKYGSESGLYPSVDHKISIYYGFLNGIIPLIISDISNLCITKRGINSKKRDMNEDEFKMFI